MLNESSETAAAVAAEAAETEERKKIIRRVRFDFGQICFFLNSVDCIYICINIQNYCGNSLFVQSFICLFSCDSVILISIVIHRYLYIIYSECMVSMEFLLKLLTFVFSFTPESCVFVRKMNSNRDKNRNLLISIYYIYIRIRIIYIYIVRFLS